MISSNLIPTSVSFMLLNFTLSTDIDSIYDLSNGCQNQMKQSAFNLIEVISSTLGTSELPCRGLLLK